MNTSGKTAIKLGCMGFGNMGRALTLGVSRHPELSGQYELLAYDPYPGSRRAAELEGIALAPDPAALAEEADIILLAVKPDQAKAVLQEIAPVLGPGKLLLSIAAGLTIAALKRDSNNRCPVMRVMPNTPALVGQGVFGLCFGEDVPEDLRERLRGLFSRLGRTVELPESKMNAFTALSGSGPGYVFHFMESLAEAGVSAGLDRQSAAAIALELLKGCAAMVEETGLHPAILREQVASPAGTTIAGINHLDRCGMRGQIVDAVLAAMARGKAMEGI